MALVIGIVAAAVPWEKRKERRKAKEEKKKRKKKHNIKQTSK